MGTELEGKIILNVAKNILFMIRKNDDKIYTHGGTSAKFNIIRNEI